MLAIVVLTVTLNAAIDRTVTLARLDQDMAPVVECLGLFERHAEALEDLARLSELLLRCREFTSRTGDGSLGERE